MKQRIPKAIYKVAEEGLNAKEAARRLSLPPSTLANWVKVAKTDKSGEIGKNQRPLTDVELELAKTKREFWRKSKWSTIC